MQREFEWALDVSKRELKAALENASQLDWRATADSLFQELWKTWQGEGLVKGRNKDHPSLAEASSMGARKTVELMKL
jgi:hypothetical protein